MKTRKNRLLAIALAGFGFLALAVNLVADHNNGGIGVPPNLPVYYDGQLQLMKLTDSTDMPPGAFPSFYVVVDANGNVEGVVSAIPGEPAYSGRWNKVNVTVTGSRDVTANPFLSDDEILAAQAAGKVQIVDAGSGFACPILPKK